jgi:hypothetical protein
VAKEECLVKSGKKPGVVAECQYDFGGDLNEMVAIFGKDVVFSSAKQKIKPRLLDYGRSLIEADTDPVEVGKKMAAWKPGVAGPRLPKDPKEKVRTLLAKLSDEDRKALLASLK